MLRTRSRVSGAFLGLCCALLSQNARAVDFHYEVVLDLPFTAGLGTLSDLAFDGAATAALYARLDSKLVLYRFAPDGSVLLDHQIGTPTQVYYQPSLCWDGAGYAVAVSTITQAEFMRVSTAGDSLLAPTALPGIPFQHRTAAFRVRCTAQGYAVFGLVLERTAPGSEVYYTYVYYWLLNAAGQVLEQRDLGLTLAPISYVGQAGVGTEKEYYDVAVAGGHYFVAYSAECGSPPVFQTCYRTFDTAGTPLRDEAPATVLQTKGPHLATDGVTVALATLRQELMPPLGGGNKLYARFFQADGTPLALETRYDAAGDFPLGYAPVIFRYGAHFFPAYVYPNPFNLFYTLKIAEFDANGALVTSAQPVQDPDNLLGAASINLGIDLQLIAAGMQTAGKGQDGIVTIDPIFFLLPAPATALGQVAALIALASCCEVARRGQRQRK